MKRALLILILCLLSSGVVFADDCSTAEDCLDTGNVGGVISGIISAVAGGAIAAGVASATAGATAAAAETGEDGEEEPQDDGEPRTEEEPQADGDDELPEGWINDTKVVGGDEAIDELVEAGAERDPDNPGCIRASSMPNIGGRIHGVAYSGDETICPDDVAVIVDWPHPAGDPIDEWVGGNEGEMSERGPVDDLVDGLRERGIEPEIIIDEDGNTHVRIPDNLPDNVSGIGYGTRTVIDENGNRVTVVDSGVWVQHWPPDGEPPIESEPEPEPEEEPIEEEPEEEEPQEEEPPEEEEEEREPKVGVLQIQLQKLGLRARSYHAEIDDSNRQVSGQLHMPGRVATQLALAAPSDTPGGGSMPIAFADYKATFNGRPIASGQTDGNGAIRFDLPADFAYGTGSHSFAVGTLLDGNLLSNVRNFQSVQARLAQTTSRSSAMRAAVSRLQSYPDQWLQQIGSRAEPDVRQAINALNLLRYMAGITRMTYLNFYAHYNLFAQTLDEFFGAFLGVVAVPFMLGKLFGMLTAVPSRIWGLVPQFLKNLLWRALSKARSAMRKALATFADTLAARLGLQHERIRRWAGELGDNLPEGESFFGNIGRWLQQFAMRCVGLVVVTLSAIWLKLGPHLVRSLGMTIHQLPNLSPLAKKGAQDTIKWVADQITNAATDLENVGQDMIDNPDATHDIGGISARVRQRAQQELQQIERHFAARLNAAVDRSLALQVARSDWQSRTSVVSSEIRDLNRAFQSNQELENFIVQISDWVRLLFEFLSVAIFLPVYLLNRAISNFIFGLSKLQSLLLRQSGLPTRMPTPQSFDTAKIFLDLLDLFIVKTGIVIRQVSLLAAERARLDHVYERLYL